MRRLLIWKPTLLLIASLFLFSSEKEINSNLLSYPTSNFLYRDDPCPHHDIILLTKLYNSLGGANWVHNYERFNKCDSFELWFGISCEKVRVSEIEIDCENTKRQILIQISNNSYLKSVDMNVYNIDNTIRSAISDLKKLEENYFFV